MITRRQFVQSTAALVGVTGLSPAPSLFAAEAKGTAMIACRDAHLDEIGAPDVWSAAKQIGISGMEVWIDEDRSCRYLSHPDKKYSIKTEEDIAALAQDLKANNLAVTAFCMANRFDERLEEELEWTQDVVRACKTLSVNAIRIDVVQRAIKDAGEFLKFSIDLGKKLAQIVEGTEIRFGIENHGNTTNNPEFLDPLFAGVGSDALGLTLDTANFYWYGHPLDRLYEIYAKYAARACHTHCKSINYPADKQNAERPRGWEYGKYCSPIYEGDIDFAKVIAILKQAGYKGDYCIENESLGRFPEAERGEILRKEAEHLRQRV